MIRDPEDPVERQLAGLDGVEELLPGVPSLDTQYPAIRSRMAPGGAGFLDTLIYDLRSTVYDLPVSIVNRQS
jgi:hypothetical protein